MAKLRMQVERAGGERTFGYTNVFHGVARIVSDEGWRGIFRGAGARIAFQVCECSSLRRCVECVHSLTDTTSVS